MVARSKRRKLRTRPQEEAQPAAKAPPSYLLPCLLLVAVIFLAYAGSYRFPLVFDDKLINPVQLPWFVTSCFRLENRCLSHTTFGLTFLAVGIDVLWFRIGNVLLHALTAIALFVFLDRLFKAALEPQTGTADPGSAAKLRLVAFSGAVLFALHPVTVYGVGYLVQRTIVMSTLFSLLSLTAYVNALMRKGRWWLWLAAALYAAAILSKEHAIMLPAAAVVLSLLLRKWPATARWERALLAAGVVAVGAIVTYTVMHVLGSAYEYYTRELGDLKQADGSLLSPTSPYLRSVATQTLLFFKYVLTWLIPYPGWMSVDLRQPIAASFLEFPFIVFFFAFLGWGIGAILLVRRGGALGLAGFAMLFPWLLFFTEFVTVRFQEPLVLYRGYLWMAGIPAALPLVLRRLSLQQILIGCVVLAVVFGIAMRERLATFAGNLPLWDDVVRKNTDLSLTFVDRGYGNRAVALLREGRLDAALRDLEMTIKLNPNSSHAYVNRGTVLRQQNKPDEALRDFDRAIEMDPAFAEAHGERCAMLLGMNRLEDALPACNEALRLAPDMPNALLNRAILHARAGRIQNALDDLGHTLKHEPNNAIALFNRGMVYKQAGRKAESDQDLQASCRLGFAPACSARR